MNTFPAPTLPAFEDNLMICGGAGTGGTIALQHLAAQAAKDGWQVHLVSIKEPRQVAGLDDVPCLATCFDLPDASWVEHMQAVVEAVEAIEPGTAERPVFVGLDNALALLMADGPEHEHEHEHELELSGRYERAALRLVEAPHTLLAARMQLPRVGGGRLERRLRSRILMGRANDLLWARVFGVTVPTPATTAMERGSGWQATSIYEDPHHIQVPFNPIRPAAAS